MYQLPDPYNNFLGVCVCLWANLLKIYVMEGIFFIINNLHHVALSRCKALIFLPSGALSFLILIDNDV